VGALAETLAAGKGLSSAAAEQPAREETGENSESNENGYNSGE
jgi:hypothetical protein